MRSLQHPLFICVMAFLGATAITAAAQQPAMSRELLLFMEVPTVVSATGREQPLTQAPSAITVITAEDIGRSGATSIPELLRSVPGLDFFRTSASEVSIASRGLNRFDRSRMQVLVDGLSVYEDVLGLIYWHQIPLPLEEIDRIEIVRSPATALYGDKAFAGVVHIITKSPETLQGTHLSGTAGGAGTGIANLIHAVVSENLSYKVSAGYDRTNQFPNPAVGRTRDELGRLDQRGHFQVNYKLSDVSKVSLSGGIDEFDRREVIAAGPFQEVASGGLGFVKANFARGDLNVQLSYNRFDADIRSPSFTQDISAVADIYQGRLQQSLALGHQNTFTGGAVYRGATLDSQGLVGGHVAQHLFTFFLQDEWQLRDNLALTVGLGVDVHSEAGVSASPRASLVYSPWKDHTFRLSVARALRNPALLENFEMLVLNQVPPLFRPFAIPPPPTFTIQGDTKLDPEEMLSYELGYQTLLFERLRVRLDLFYNRLDRLIIPVQPIFSQLSPSLPLLTGEQFVNIGRGSILGGEVGLDFFITSWLIGFLNYSYQDTKGSTFAMGFASHHKGNVGLTLALTKALSATLLVHHVGELELPPNGVNAWANPYTIVNCRLGYRLTWFQHEVELAIQAFNVLDDVHREIPDGDLIERRVSGTIRFRF